MLSEHSLRGRVGADDSGGFDFLLLPAACCLLPIDSRALTCRREYR